MVECIPPDPDIVYIHCKKKKYVKVCGNVPDSYYIIDCGKLRG